MVLSMIDWQEYSESFRTAWQDFVASPEGVLNVVLGFFSSSVLMLPLVFLAAALCMLMFVLILSPFSVLRKALGLHSRLAAVGLCLLTLASIGFFLAAVWAVVFHFVFINSSMSREQMEGHGALLLAGIAAVALSRVLLEWFVRRQRAEDAPMREACSESLKTELLGPRPAPAGGVPATVAMTVVDDAAIHDTAEIAVVPKA